MAHRLMILGVLFFWMMGVARAEPLSLKVARYKNAIILVPPGQENRPVVIGFHGNFDRPEWFCGMLEMLVQGRAWALCPRGIPRTDVPKEYDRWTFPNRQRVMAELEAALAALNEQYPNRVRNGPMILSGFSLGAILASRFAIGDPKRFPLIYLVEGGHHVWTPEAIQSYGRRGGAGIVFGCGRRGCEILSRRICDVARNIKLQCQVIFSNGLGHSYVDPLPQQVLPVWNKMIAPHLR